MNNTCCAALNTWHELNVSLVLTKVQRFVVEINYWFREPAMKNQKGENPVSESCEICVRNPKILALYFSHTHTCSCTKGKEKNISCWHCCPFFSLNSQNAARETSSHDPFTWYKISTLLASMKMSFNICCISSLYQHSTSSSSNPLSFTAQESVNATKYTLLHYSSNQIKIWNIMVGVSSPPSPPIYRSLLPNTLSCSNTLAPQWFLIPCNALLC